MDLTRPIPEKEAVAGAASNAETDTMAVVQYLMNPQSGIRIAIFGHTHEPKIKTFTNLSGQKVLYANSGTWIDDNPDKTTMNFVIITPQEAINEMARDSLRL